MVLLSLKSDQIANENMGWEYLAMEPSSGISIPFTQLSTNV